MATAWGKQWDRTVKFRDLINDDTSSENAIRTGKGIASRVAAAIPESDTLRDSELTDIIDDLEQVEDCDELNSVLCDLYDWADEGKRLWVSP